MGDPANQRWGMFPLPDRDGLPTLHPAGYDRRFRSGGGTGRRMLFRVLQRARFAFVQNRTNLPQLKRVPPDHSARCRALVDHVPAPATATTTTQTTTVVLMGPTGLPNERDTRRRGVNPGPSLRSTRRRPGRVPHFPPFQSGFRLGKLARGLIFPSTSQGDNPGLPQTTWPHAGPPRWPRRA